MENFQFLSVIYWFNNENSFKKAVKIQALNGIFLNTLILVLVLTFHSTLLPVLTLLPILAMLFLALSILLLKRLNNNDRDEVFEIVKIASGTLAGMNLLQGIISVITIIYKSIESDMYTGSLIVGVLNFTLTALGVYGIWKRNLKLFSAFIIYSYIQSLLTVYLLFMFYLNISLSVIFFPLLFILLWKFFLIFFFVLHHNIINFTATNQQSTNTETEENIGLQQV